MRMDRYEEDNMDASKRSRTDKNQELYTDVYLNNAYVDINEISDVVNDNEENVDIKKKLDVKTNTYAYEEKNYDINELINQAIENNDDKLKRSIEQTTEIENIIKSINESQSEKKENENLLSDLLADSDTTTIVGPLEDAIVDTKEMDTSIIHKDEMSNEMLESILEDDDKKEVIKNQEVKGENEEIDDSLKDETKINKKKIFIIIGIAVVIIAIVIGILIYKKII